MLVRLKDAIWCIKRDRTSAARGIADLTDANLGESASAIGAFWAIEATFVDEQLESIPVLRLLTEPVQELSRHWNRGTSPSRAGYEPVAT